MNVASNVAATCTDFPYGVGGREEEEIDPKGRVRESLHLPVMRPTQSSPCKRCNPAHQLRTLIASDEPVLPVLSSRAHSLVLQLKRLLMLDQRCSINDALSTAEVQHEMIKRVIM